MASTTTDLQVLLASLSLCCTGYFLPIWHRDDRSSSGVWLGLDDNGLFLVPHDKLESLNVTRAVMGLGVLCILLAAIVVAFFKKNSAVKKILAFPKGIAFVLAEFGGALTGCACMHLIEISASPVLGSMLTLTGVFTSIFYCVYSVIIDVERL